MGSRHRSKHFLSRCTSQTLRRPSCTKEARSHKRLCEVKIWLENVFVEENRENYFNYQIDPTRSDSATFEIMNQKFSNNISYSMNKQKRWDLIHCIKGNYEKLKCIQQSELTISSHHLINRSGTCIDFFTNDARCLPTATSEMPQSICSRKKRGYVNAHSFMQKRNQEFPIDEVIKPRLHIQVLKGVHDNGGIDPKIHGTKCLQKMYRAYSDPFLNKNYSKSMRKDLCGVINDFDPSELDVDEDIEIQVQKVEECLAKRAQNFDIMDCVVIKPKQRKRHKSSSDSRNDSLGRKGRIFYIDEDYDHVCETKKTEEHEVVPMEEVEILHEDLPSIQVVCDFPVSQNLIQHYGSAYTSTASSPKQHILEMENGFLLIEVVGDKVELSLKSNIAYERAIQELRLISDSVQMIGWAALKSLVVQKLSVCLESTNDFEAQVVTEEDVRVAILQSSKEAMLSNDSKAHEDTEIAVGECEICLESWDNASENKSNRGTALIDCGHWFCNVCWQRHLLQSVKTGLAEISCPAHDCSTQVDKGTLASHLPLKFYRQHENVLVNTIINGRKSSFHQCKCGRLLQLSSHQAVTNICLCGASVCSKCHQEAHWPVKCSTAKKYLSKAETMRHDHLLTSLVREEVLVKGKKCPHCRTFIEKNDGCNHMSCICKFQFCWWCLKDYSIHKNGPCNDYRSNNTFVEETEFVFTENETLLIPNSTLSRAYCYAIQCRAERKQYVATFKQNRHQLIAAFRKKEDGKYFSWAAHQSAQDHLRKCQKFIIQGAVAVEYCFGASDYISDKRVQRIVRYNAHNLHYLIKYLCLLGKAIPGNKILLQRFSNESDVLIAYGEEICKFLSKLM